MMIAARNAFLMGGDKPWQNPYITDGLVAMWDGEWNIGGGSHRADASTWVDLSGNGLDMISNGDPVFFSQYIQPTSLQQLWHTNTTDMFDGCISSGTFTAEVAFLCESTTGNSNKMLVFGGGENTHGFSVAPWFYDDGDEQGPRTGTRPYIGTTYATAYSRRLLSGTISLASNAGTFYGTIISKGAAYRGSNSRTPPVPYTSKRFTIGYRYNYTPSDPMTNGKERVYCIRIYNRTLSLDELKAGAAIDAARFGL